MSIVALAPPPRQYGRYFNRAIASAARCFGGASINFKKYERDGHLY